MVNIPKEETIQQIKIRNVIGEKEDLPSLSPRVSLASRIRALTTKFFGVPQLIHLYGALGLNKTLTLTNNEILSLFSDGTYLYAGLNTHRIVKIDLATFTEVSTLTLTDDGASVYSLFSDGTYLYAGLYHNYGRIVKIELSTFTEVDTLTFSASSEVVRSLFSDGTYLYAGISKDPGEILKVNLSTFTEVSTLTLTAGKSYPHTLFSDGTYLYTGTESGHVVKIDLSTFTEVSSILISGSVPYVRSLFSDGTYLYAGIFTIPGRISKIDLSTFTEVSTLTLTASDEYVTSIFSDGTYLYVGTYSLPGRIVKIDLSTFTIISIIIFEVNEDFVRAVFSDGIYLYAGLYTSPGKVIRKYIIPSNDQHQRKIDITNTSVQSTISASTSVGLSTTLIDIARTEGNDYWNGLTILILGGACKGQSRQITDFDAASDTITVSPAFTAAIASGVRYAILPGGSGSSTLVQADILNDATPFAGADIAIIKADTQTIEDSTLKAAPTAGSLATFIASGGTSLGTPLPNSKSLYDTIALDRLDNAIYGLSAIENLVDDLETRLTAARAGYLDNLTGTVTNGTYSHANNTTENDVLVFAAAKLKIDLFLDMVNIAQSTTIREYIKVDGTTYRLISQKVFPTDFDTNTKAISISFEQPNRDYKVTFQSGTAEGSAKDVPYTYITLPRT